MRVLAIDTASDRCSAALLMQGRVRERCRLVPKGHGQWILSMVDGLLEESNTKLSDLDAIAFGRGPGAFTGVRMAIGVAQGLALATDVPVVPVSDLAMIAQGAVREHQVNKVLVAVDARMAEVYWGGFVVENGLVRPQGDEIVCPPSESPEISDYDWHACGTGWASYPKLVDRYKPHLLSVEGDRLPRAEDALLLAVRDLEAGLAVPAERAAPTYLRDKVAWR